MRKYGAIILIIIGIMISGCSNRTYSACVNQPIDAVTKIELLDTHGDKEVILYTLKDSEIRSFWTEFMNLGFNRYFNDPATEYGVLSVRITYTDGYTDIIGTDINGYYDISGKSMQVGWYYLSDINDYISLFAHYVDESALPTMN